MIKTSLCSSSDSKMKPKTLRTLPRNNALLSGTMNALGIMCRSQSLVWRLSTSANPSHVCLWSSTEAMSSGPTSVLPEEASRCLS